MARGARRLPRRAEPTVPYEPVPVPPVGGGGLLETAVGTPTQPLPPVPPATQPVQLSSAATAGAVTQMPGPAAPLPLDPRATEYENDSVVEALNAIIDQDSDYMKLARTAGLQTANRRGLLNTSIAAGTSQAAAIAAAAPLAQQEAGQRASRNLARINAFFTKEQQAKDIEARERMLATQLRSEEERLGRQLTSQETMQARDIVSQQFMQTRQIEATKLITQMNIAAAEKNLERQLTSQEKLQIAQLSAEEARLKMQIASQEALTREGIAADITRTEMTEAGALERAQLEATTRIQQQEMATLAENQRAALGYYLSQDQIYANSITNLYANENLPAPARDAAIQQLTALKNAGADMPAAVLGIQLNWGTPTAPLPPGVTIPGTTPPPAAPPAAPAPTPTPVAPAPSYSTTTPASMSKLAAAKASGLLGLQ
jgi:hypothetical protein